MWRVSRKAFWIVMPLIVTAVSILGVSRLRRQITKPPLPVAADAAIPAPAANPPAPPSPAEVTIPAQTEISVRLNQSLATNRATAGDPFFATVADPVEVNGQVVIPQGAAVKGRVISVSSAGRLKGVAKIRLTLDSVEVRGSSYDLSSNTFARIGEKHKKRNWEMIGGGGGGGALLGALAGGGKGLLIGAPIGAGAGLAGSALTGKSDLVIPAETAMTFRLLAPLEIPL